jgi:hypothetical protein
MCRVDATVARSRRACAIKEKSVNEEQAEIQWKFESRASSKVQEEQEIAAYAALDQ